MSAPSSAPTRGSRTLAFLASLGRRSGYRVKESVLSVQEYALLSWRGLIAIFTPPRYTRDIIAQMDSLGVGSLSIVILVGTGLIIGFSFQTGILEILAGFALLLLFGYAFSWIFALIGMSVSSPEAANGIGFTIIFPITFISSAFVPVESMPAGLEKFAEINPITIVVDAMRALWLGVPAGNNVWGAVVWCLVLIAIFAPLAVRKYRRTAGR